MAETFGRYTVLDRLGAGTLGDVYRARDTNSGRTVALRVLSADPTGDADRSARVLERVRAAARVSHPNIAAIYEVGEDHGRPFVATEFVPGESLAQLAGGRPMNPRQGIGFAIQIADALAEAHALGLEHGYLGTANVIVTPKGHAKILDFGTAEWTRSGAVHGRRADLEALGWLLAELLRGRMVPGATPAGPALTSGAQHEADTVAARLMSGRDGYESAATAAAALRAIADCLDARVSVVVPPRAASAPPRSSRAPLFWLLAVAGIVGLLALVWAAMRAY